MGQATFSNNSTIKIYSSGYLLCTTNSSPASVTVPAGGYALIGSMTVTGAPGQTASIQIPGVTIITATGSTVSSLAQAIVSGGSTITASVTNALGSSAVCHYVIFSNSP